MRRVAAGHRGRDPEGEGGCAGAVWPGEGAGAGGSGPLCRWEFVLGATLLCVEVVLLPQRPWLLSCGGD